MGVRVVGERELAKLANELKLVAGGSAIRRELLKEIKKIPKPLIAEIRAESRAILPHKGGLAEYIADATYKTEVSIRANTVRAKITGWRTRDAQGRIRAGAGRVDIRRIDKGRLRRPTYGHRPWKTQDVDPGFFEGPTVASADDLAAAVRQVVDTIKSRLG